MPNNTPRAAALIALLVLAAVVVFIVIDDDTTGDATPVSGAALLGARRTNADATPPAVPFDSSTPRLVLRARRTLPHDTAAFTQGLLIDGGRLVESTGLEGRSAIRELDPVTGDVTERAKLAAAHFGEGIAVVGQRLYQLTWRSGRAFVYDAASLALLDSLSYDGEGWGLTSDGAMLYMSDGTDRIRVLSPATFQVVGSVRVTESGRPVWMLNELEWVRGELWANVYQTDLVARIDPVSGRITGWLDLSALQSDSLRRPLRARGGVANGIAVDTLRRRAFVTGKLWPSLYEVDLPRPLEP